MVSNRDEVDSPVASSVEVESVIGARIELEIERVAHGGHCVARWDTRVVFVRHALPGERVLVEVTEQAAHFLRGDAVEVLRPSPDRVTPPCPHSHPGGCGGCDFQHARPAAQRALKAAVVAEQFQRLAGLAVAVEVSELPGHPDGLGWRRRVRYAADATGNVGLRAHRSHVIVPVERCPLGAPGVGDAPLLARSATPDSELEVAVDDRARVAVTSFAPRPATAAGPRRERTRSHQRRRATRAPLPTPVLLSGPDTLEYRVSAAGLDYSMQVGAAGFWQTHPAAAQTFLDRVLAEAQVRSGEVALDLYCGAGLFTVPLADAVGATGRVVGVEASSTAVADARANLGERPWAQLVERPVSAQALARIGAADVVVLDPPRTGAGAEIMRAVLDAEPRVILYVACDPAALARDVATVRDLGWELDALVAFDAFPMTHHVECVATLRPAAQRLS